MRGPPEPTLPLHYAEDHPTTPPHATVCGWTGYDRPHQWAQSVTSSRGIFEASRRACRRCRAALRKRRTP
jgi:hypothetical protein